MSYTFVYSEGAWYLKISDLEGLQQYWEEFSKKIQQETSTIIETKEYGHGMNHATAIQMAIVMKARNVGDFVSNEEASHDILCDTRKMQYQAVISGRDVYVNRNFGWNAVPKKAEQFVHKSEFSFPRMLDNLVKIEKFPMGQHYYLFIDGVQIRRNEEELKFDSYDEARAYADKYVYVKK